MDDPSRLDATTAAALIARRELSAEALLRACLARIAERDGELRAFVCLDVQGALAQARALDAGPLRGPLHGLPLGVKDIFDTRDLPTECGSPIFAGHRPRVDAAAVALCREAGAVVIGKTVTTELANMTAGATRNPFNPAHTPGGSSSGSAAAVADFMVPLSLGTQTAGSLIRPAACCGIAGFKPSFGRVPRAGVKPNADSMDTVGGFGRTVADAALLGAVLTGDKRLVQQPLPDTLRIGLVQGPDWGEAESDVQAAWARAVQALAPQAQRCEDAALPADFGDVAAVQAALQAHETAAALADEHRRHPDLLSPALLALLDKGRTIGAVEIEAHRTRTARWRFEVDALFDGFDVLLAPSAVDEAPEGLQHTGDPVFCRPWSLLGLPSVHLPFATGSTGLPVGLQLVGRHGEDHRLMAAAQWAMQRLA
ncbi:amidase [Piscinibacter sp.]|jgi:Asp-tRNA(Asn)/Glu-tRNA(Gln) amidotransferase A subunit family amidase|uniref:amidase n=1 Tax=Piscinibacter sp. TaxID=1903157 RepID=UPI001B75752A|nr:amidase [Piscinibacter sp.]MBK7532199.1 amidase [Piscinibacter sp.]MBP6542120.1 amidase [Piscinibacter sp.]HPG78401.1 amidase [Piscinibacter sp.]